MSFDEMQSSLSSVPNENYYSESYMKSEIKKAVLKTIDEFANRVLMKANYFNLDTEDIEEFNENVESVIYSVVDDMKEKNNENNYD